MKSFRELSAALNEARAKYDTNHDTYTSAIDNALAYAKAQGYEIDPDDTFNAIGAGPRKPGEGKTNRFSIPMKKNGKEVRQHLQIQVYGKGQHGYELNTYIA